MKHLVKDKPYEIVPEAVIFKDVDPKETYFLNMSIRSFNKKPMKCKVSQPRKHPDIFKVVFHKTKLGKAAGI